VLNVFMIPACSPHRCESTIRQLTLRAQVPKTTSSASGMDARLTPEVVLGWRG
jgi:hypothetical protein